MNNDQFFGWWNGDDLTPDNDFPKDSPIWWAWEGWQAALREMNNEHAKKRKAPSERQGRWNVRNLNAHFAGMDCWRGRSCPGG
jgi:hypothetical protein